MLLLVQADEFRVEGPPFLAFGRAAACEATAPAGATGVWRLADSPGGIETEPRFSEGDATLRGARTVRLKATGRSEADLRLVVTMERQGRRLATRTLPVRVGDLLQVPAVVRLLEHPAGGTRTPGRFSAEKMARAVDPYWLACGIEFDVEAGRPVRVTMVHLPALNAPQFGWSCNRMPNRPRPVPPIFEPEVVADAIVSAAEHEVRELLVGRPTVLAVLGNKIVPAIGDRHVARSGYAAPQTEEPATPAPDSLFARVEGRQSARGPFRGRTTSVQSWLVTRGRPYAAGALAGLVVALAGAVFIAPALLFFPVFPLARSSLRPGREAKGMGGGGRARRRPGDPPRRDARGVRARAGAAGHGNPPAVRRPPRATYPLLPIRMMFTPS